MSTVSSPTVAPSSRLIPPTSGFLDSAFDPVLNHTWAGIVCFIVFILYASIRNKNSYVTAVLSPFQLIDYTLHVI